MLNTESSHPNTTAVEAPAPVPTAELRAISHEAAELQECMTRALGVRAFGQWLLGHYARAAGHAAREAGTAGLPLEVLSRLTRDLSALMRWSHTDQRLDHDQARVLLEERFIALEEQQTKKAMEKQFEQWLQRPEVQARFDRSKMSEEEQERRMRKILGRER